MAPSAAPAGSTRLKRSAIALLVIVLASIGVLVVRATIAVETARQEVEDALTSLVGVPVRLTGSPTVRLLPWPSVRFEHVAVERGDGGPPLARMDGLDVRLDVAALLLGRLRPEELRMIRPDIRVESAGRRPSVVDFVAVATAWKPVTVSIEKGRVTFAAPDGDEHFETVDARLSWPRLSANLLLRAGLRWRGEAIGLDLEAPSPERLLAGEEGSTSLRLTSAPLRLSLSGEGGLIAPTRFEGSADIEIIDAQRFARWTGRPRTPDLLAGRIRLDGPLSMDARGVTMPNVRVDLAGNRAGGALTLRWDGSRPRLSGTVAFDELDFTGDRRRPYGRGWRDLAIDRASQTRDFDLRLSAPRIRLPGLTLDRVAASLHVSEGRLAAEIGNAELFGKPISATLRGTLVATGLEARLRLGGDDLPFADIADLVEAPGVEAGRASVVFEGDARCATLGACLAAVDGRLRLEARAARVTGSSPFADMSRFRPIVPQANGGTVTSLWDTVTLDMRLQGPRATVDRAEILGQNARFLFAGKGDLASGALDLIGHAFFPAHRPDVARSGTTEVSVPMRIGGTLQRPEAMARDAAPTTGGQTQPPAVPQ
ncbi:MAG: hypothetical protein OEL76_04720 [Siculibacillus sp.]|nr:hypothetical protein [Siculibacillus sp.]